MVCFFLVYGIDIDTYLNSIAMEKGYYDRFGTPTQKQARKDDMMVLPKVALAFIVLMVLLGASSCSSHKTAQNCASYGMSWDRTQPNHYR